MRCFGCMRPIDDAQAVCEHCGHDNHVRQNGPGMLKETILNHQYLVGRILGRGGFGITYIGYDLLLDRVVAIKEYYPSQMVSRMADSQLLSVLSDSTENFRKGRERAMRESRIAAGIGQIPGVVQVYNVVQENNTIYIVMEYIEGCTLKNYVQQRQEPIPLKEAVGLLAPVAEALQKLHEKKLIHRDVKPENIMIRDATGESVLLDFGSARVQDGSTLSLSAAVVSAGYSPIEQYSSYGLDGRLDEYALSATLYYVLTGKAPKEALLRIAEGPELEPVISINPTVSSAAQEVLLKGMFMNAQDRYASLGEMWNALLHADEAKKQPLSAKRLAALAACAAVLAGGIWFWQWISTDNGHAYEANIRWYQESIEAGHEGNYEIMEEEVARLMEAAEQPEAADEQYQLANLYRDGIGVEENARKAAEYYRRAAEQGHADAMCELARCFEEGRGVSQNTNRAYEWYQKALDGGKTDVEKDLARVMNLLGVSYHEGAGVKRDYEKAVEWFQKAADLGNKDAMNNLGKCYYYGRGVEQDMKLANEWYDKAAK